MADDSEIEFETKRFKDKLNKHINEKENVEINEKNCAEKYSSLARKPTHGTIDKNILNFFYSYAYHCRKYFNLCVIDKNTIVFATGNLIQFFNTAENKIWFEMVSIGYGIGHISKNSVSEHIAIGINGMDPLINVYDWPSMKIAAILRGGTTKRYSYLTYSPDGLLLVSQGGEPDYYISIWNWKESNIILQCKSYVQDVYNVTFSKYIPGQLTSSGLGHIKFWKMSKTFTGLKLKADTGKFGNTEISDIVAIHPMPNETVISGCEWGNILLWDESLIKLEAHNRNKETAHAGYITQFEYINGELLSVGSDGYIKFWFYETLDHANLSDEDQFLEIQSISEIQITDRKQNAMLMCIQKQEPNNPENTHWYAQDGNGGIWLLDLSVDKKEQIQKKIFICHAGPIVDMDGADWGPFVATLDINGNLHIYNYIEKKLEVTHKFDDIGGQVIWFPCKIDKRGLTLVCAFGSGVIRMITLGIQKYTGTRLIQVLKPHSKAITVMCVNTSCSLLITGSNDATIFIFSIDSKNTYPKILPIGYVKLPSPITCMTWNPLEEATLLIGCLMGDCVEVQLPTVPQSYTVTSYELIDCNLMAFKFESVKSSIQRKIIEKEYEKRREEKLEKRRKEMEQLIAENPHIIIDEEAFLMDLDEEEVVLPEIYIPKVPNKVLLAQYGTTGNIWLCMAGFDAGYVYEYPRPLSGKIKHNKPIRSRLIEAAVDTEIHTALFCENRKYLFMGTQHGELYINKINDEDPLDFSDYLILPVHEYYGGHISKILFSYDKKLLLTCGHDGNIFSFNINGVTSYESFEIPKPEHSLIEIQPDYIEDIEDSEHPSLEELIVQKEQNKIISITKEKRKMTLQIVRNLIEEYIKVTIRNKTLLPSQQILQFELDPRISEDLNQQLKMHIILTQDKLKFRTEKNKLKLHKLIDHFVSPLTCLPFIVCSILNGDKMVHSLRVLKFDTDNILRCIELRNFKEKQHRVDRIARDEVEIERYKPCEEELQHVEVLLSEDYTDLLSGFGLQIKQILLKYKEKKLKLIQRQRQLSYSREDFNTKLKSVRLQKQSLQKEVSTLKGILKGIHMEIISRNVKPLPQSLYLNFNIEFPEYILKLGRYVSISERMQHVKRRKQSTVNESVGSMDLEYEALYCGIKKVFGEEMESFLNLVTSSKMRVKDYLPTQSDLLQNLNTSDSFQTAWEREMKRFRMWRKLYEQNCILYLIDVSYKQLETKLNELEEYRLDITYQNINMNLYLLSVYEEFIILKECEVTEQTLEKKVDEKSNECSTVLLKIQATKVNIASKQEEIQKLQTRSKGIATEFSKTIAKSKFQDFLQRIFKKKYVATKEQDGSLDSLTQLSETNSQDTDETIYSDTEHIPFDENVCPPECDKKLYEMTFSMREKRYLCELQIKEKQKEIELLFKELEINTKNLKMIENVLKNNQEDFKNFLVEKHKKLNNVDVTILLKIHQLQHVLDSTYMAEIQNCVIFNKKQLSNLYNRIKSLQMETHNLEENRKKNELHLKRIKPDLKYMENQIKELKTDIKEKMIQKFGREVSLINFYATILQRLIYDTKLDVYKIMRNFSTDINYIKWNCKKALIVLEQLIRDNTEKLSLLTMLEKEKFNLAKNLKHILLPEENMLHTELGYKVDITMLENILHHQMQQKHFLLQCITNFKTAQNSKGLQFNSCLNNHIIKYN